MKTVSISVLAGVVGCGFLLQAPSARAATEKVVYSFCPQQNCTDGNRPFAALIDVNGMLYGTTYAGGAYDDGTVFSINPKTGGETVLHSFNYNGVDGFGPYASLLDVNGTLYGTTMRGGSQDMGTVFSINPATGAETVLYSSCSQQQQNCTDAIYPEAGLLYVKGTLYGTAIAGGANEDCGGSCGAVFSIDPNSGAEKVIHSFNENGTDGWGPYAGLIYTKGALYGTTSYGGSNCVNSGGCGTVFSINLKKGTETVVYSFCSQQNCADGSIPEAGLLNVDGALYGTTESGGTLDSFGTVFSIDPTTRTEAVVHAFAGAPDGAVPVAGLIDVGGFLYGTTRAGGSNQEGSVFSINTQTGTETVAHSFGGGGDGIYPYAAVVKIGGKLYGTAIEGGSSSYCNGNGCGAVFEITP